MTIFVFESLNKIKAWLIGQLRGKREGLKAAIVLHNEEREFRVELCCWLKHRGWIG